MRYLLVKEGSSYELEREVARLVGGFGWRPQGGVSFQYQGMSETWAQALTKEGEACVELLS